MGANNLNNKDFKNQFGGYGEVDEDSGYVFTNEGDLSTVAAAGEFDQVAKTKPVCYSETVLMNGSMNVGLYGGIFDNPTEFQSNAVQINSAYIQNLVTDLGIVNIRTQFSSTLVSTSDTADGSALVEPFNDDSNQNALTLRRAILEFPITDNVSFNLSPKARMSDLMDLPQTLTQMRTFTNLLNDMLVYRDDDTMIGVSYEGEQGFNANLNHWARQNSTTNGIFGDSTENITTFALGYNGVVSDIAVNAKLIGSLGVGAGDNGYATGAGVTSSNQNNYGLRFSANTAGFTLLGGFTLGYLAAEAAGDNTSLGLMTGVRFDQGERGSYAINWQRPTKKRSATETQNRIEATGLFSITDNINIGASVFFNNGGASQNKGLVLNTSFAF